MAKFDTCALTDEHNHLAVTLVITMNNWMIVWDGTDDQKLCEAAFKNNVAEATALVEKGADVNTQQPTVRGAGHTTSLGC